MKIHINSEGYLESPYTQDATIEMEIMDQETIDKLSSFPFYYNWQYKDGKWNLVCINENAWLRLKRQRKCFDVLDNKSQMWYQMLTDEQTAELKEWYQAWLNVTDTKVMPETPSWIK